MYVIFPDIDECQEQNIQCGANRMCFNMRGSYQCIDTPCPPNYQRDTATGYAIVWLNHTLKHLIQKPRLCRLGYFSHI